VRGEMARKGNLLFNGDFETGTEEGWIKKPFGLGDDYYFECWGGFSYRGDYSGFISCPNATSNAYISYNKTCSFEEYSGYLFIAYLYNVSMEYSEGRIYGLDDKGNLINHFGLGRNYEKEEWQKITAILRGFGDITHFAVGIRCYSYNSNEDMYFDEVKLIPLRSVEGHVLAEYLHFDDLQYVVDKYVGLACIGTCRLTSILRISEIQGTDAVLKTSLKIHLLDSPNTVLEYSHSDFTDTGLEKITIDLPEVSFIEIRYNAGTDGDKFDIDHHLRLEPE